jgi:dTDP-4-amino-4,6-dideoxygalactose transaminase
MEERITRAEEALTVPGVRSPVHVTRTFLPPMEEYTALLEGVWNARQVTNNGALVRRLENELAGRFDLPNPLFLGNGTIALQMALRALDITGEVITTPYSYVASTTAILWERCTPVFADIDPVSF